MLAFLRDLLLGPAPSKVENTVTPSERFGSRVVSTRLADELFKDSRRRRLITCISGQLLLGPNVNKVPLVDDLIRRFALYVLDLPASEKHHGARPYGLLDHSLEVAYETVARLHGLVLKISEDPSVQLRELPLWHYAAFVMALLHDVGKVLDLYIATADESDQWNPLAEPLAAFCERQGRTTSGPELWRYYRGRGCHFHEWHGPMVYSLLLTPTVTAYLGRRLPLVSDALLALGLAKPVDAPVEIALQIARVIHEMDQKCSSADRGIVTTLPAPKTEPVQPPLPPLDLAELYERFRDALVEAMDSGIVLLNEGDGVYVGDRHVYVQMRSFEIVMFLLEKNGAGLDERFKREWSPDVSSCMITPEANVIRSLLHNQALPYATETRNWFDQGKLCPLDEAEGFFHGLVANRDLLPDDLPCFEGRVVLDRPSIQEKEGPAPVAGPPGSFYERRVEAELGKERLTETLLSALRDDFFHEPGGWSLVYRRPDAFWVLVPGALQALLRRRGIELTGDLQEKVVRSLELPLRTIRLHPESRDIQTALAIPAQRVIVEGKAVDLPVWPHEVTVL